jgi:hypothetical protein
MSRLTVCFTTLCMLAGPALATPQEPAAIVEKSPLKKPASPTELDQYKAREQLAQNLEKFEGGRGRGIEVTTLLLILLIVLLVLIIL